MCVWWYIVLTKPRKQEGVNQNQMLLHSNYEEGTNMAASMNTHLDLKDKPYGQIVRVNYKLCLFIDPTQTWL